MAYIYKTGRIELIEQIRGNANVVSGRVLDVGAGKLSRYKHLFTYDEYVTMDIAPGANVDIVGSIEHIPVEDTSFDAIVCTQVIGDVYDLAQAFREMYRVLKKDGVLVLTENLFDSLHDEPHDFWRFTEHSLRKLAEDAGFAVEVLERRGGYWSVRAQMSARYWIERLNAPHKWFARPLSFLFRILGAWARFLDSRDKSHANQIFTHGYLLIARKK